MTFDLKNRVHIARSLSGGVGLKELSPHAVWFQAGLDLGLIKGAIQNTAPSDTTLYWFDYSDTTQTVFGTVKKWTGADWSRADTLTAGVLGGTITDAIASVIPTPANQNYAILIKLPYACTLEDLAVKTTGGTCTVQITKNGTTVGAAVAASSTQNSAGQSSVAFAAGDTFGVTVSSNSGAANLSITAAIKRAL